MGQLPDMIFKYAQAFTEGIQGKPGTFTGVLSLVKIFSQTVPHCMESIKVAQK
jgi:hypothetical protein